MFSANQNVLAIGMDVAAMRHTVIAQNIANSMTEGYRPLDVRFEENLRGLAPEQWANQAPTLIERPVDPDIGDSASGDLDVEIGRMQKNSLLFQAFSQLLAHSLSQAKSAISGR